MKHSFFTKKVFLLNVFSDELQHLSNLSLPNHFFDFENKQYSPQTKFGEYGDRSNSLLAKYNQDSASIQLDS